MKDKPVANSDLHAAAADELADTSEEFRRSRDAAEQGSANHQALLGLLYLVGEEVPQDHVQAQFWLNLAAAQGHAEAAEGLEIVGELISPDQLAEAERLAREWMEKHGKAQ